MLAEDLEGIYYILMKDLKAYYFKPPNISWGILFPIVMALAFTLRSPSNLAGLSPGLVAMAALFGTTSMEAIVITFEKRVGALERLFLAPLPLWAVLFAKVLGGSVFGLVISGVMTLLSVTVLGGRISSLPLFIIVMLLTVLVHSALGALIAVSVKEVFEAQTLSNYLRFPMIFLCGVFLPLEDMPTALRYLGRALPLTYSVEALRSLMTGSLNPTSFIVDIVALSGFLLLLTWLALGRLKKSFQ